MTARWAGTSAGRSPTVGFVVGGLAGVVPCLWPHLFPWELSVARFVGGLMVGGSAAYTIHSFNSEGKLGWRRGRLALFTVGSLATVAVLYAYCVVHVHFQGRSVAVPVGLSRAPRCCQDLSDDACIERRLTLSDSAIKLCWGTASVASVRLALVFAYWSAAVAGGASLGKWFTGGERQRPGSRDVESPAMEIRDLFISHAHEDGEFVKRLVHDLEVQGLTVWWDDGSLLVGDSLHERIPQMIEKCRQFLVVLSREAVDSKWVTDEMKMAQVLAKEDQSPEGARRLPFILPIIARPCDVPLALKDRVAADFSGSYKQGLEHLSQRLLRVD
jgi:hypothetical protein